MGRPNLKIAPYVSFEAERIRVNDSLVAQRTTMAIADHALSERDQAAMLTTALPGVPGMKQMNRSVADTRRLVDDAEADWARMALPYVLSVHEAFIMDLLAFLRSAGVDDHLHPAYKPRHSDIKLVELHKYLARCCGSPGAQSDSQYWRPFDWLRQLRNVIIHRAGRDDTGAVAKAYKELGTGERMLWTRATKREFSVTATDQVVVGAAEVNGALAVSDRLAQDMVRLVGGAKIDKDWWADYIVADYKGRFPARWPRACRRPAIVTQYGQTNFALAEPTAATLSAAVVRAR